MMSLPRAAELRETLELLLDKQVRVEPVRDPVRRPAAVATFADDTGSIGAVAALDGDVACFAGAALSMIPAGVAKQCATRGQIDGSIHENLAEVMNVLSTIFTGGASRVVLDRLYVEEIPADVRRLLRAPTSALHVRVDIPGYGAGLASVVTV
jgi:hypothetical protein